MNYIPPTIAQQNPITKEAANPISHALIALKSLRDPFRQEISDIRHDVDDVINVIDTCLYTLATGQENELRSVTSNIQAIKMTLRSISNIISRDVTNKIIDYAKMNNSPIIEQMTSLINNVEGVGVKNVDPFSTNKISLDEASLKNKENNFLDATTPDELIKNFASLKTEYMQLLEKVMALQGTIRLQFMQINNKKDIIVPRFDNDKTLAETMRDLMTRAKSIHNSLQRAAETPISSMVGYIELFDKINSKTVNASNFDAAKSTYRVVYNHYNEMNIKFNNLFNDVQLVKNQVEKMLNEAPTATKEEDVDGDDKKNGGATVIVSDSYNKVMLDFIIKHATAPSLLQDFHRGVNEIGQDVISPVSDVVRRRVRIRKSLKTIKEAVIDFLVEIRKTAGKKESIEQEIERWDIIIKSFNIIGNVLNKEIANTLISQLSMSNADVFSQRLREKDTSQTSTHDREQLRLQDSLPNLQYAMPELPSIKRLMFNVISIAMKQ